MSGKGKEKKIQQKTLNWDDFCMKSTVELSTSTLAPLISLRVQQLSRMKKNIYQMAEVELMSNYITVGWNRKPLNYQFQRYEDPIHHEGHSYSRK